MQVQRTSSTITEVSQIAKPPQVGMNGGLSGIQKPITATPLSSSIAQAGLGTITTRPSDDNMRYYSEYCRLHLANKVLLNQLKELVHEKNEMTIRLIRLEKKQEDPSGEDDQINEEELEEEKKKRIRKQANMIVRNFVCQFDQCQKSYGNENSLNQHIKMKHPKPIK